MKIQREKSASMEDVQEYARLTGDYNPIHVESDYPDRDDTYTDENIVHGMLIVGWFSSLLDDLGDSGRINGETLIGSFDANFFCPIRVDETSIVEVEIDDGDIPDDDFEQFVVDADLTARGRTGPMYVSAKAKVYIDQSVSR